jgi:tetraacyldisaccharide 4'-kinase
MMAPQFWRRDGGWAALLAPAGALYAAAGRFRRWRVTPHHVGVPVICVGNLVAGGAGKTPVALAVTRMLRDMGVAAHVVLRGYKGREAGPLQVDPARHTAEAVGDEPLLLAAAGPTWVARDRVEGARAAVRAGAPVIVLDDGHQNPTLHKDLSLVVIDGGYGIGNGRVMPAGPLREPAAEGLARASAMVLLGEDVTGVASLADGLPILRATLVPTGEAWSVRGRAVLAFAGIGRPEKFFTTLETQVGAFVKARIGFPDHHAYSRQDLEPLLRQAEELGAIPVTTVKDHVRLPTELRARITAVPVELVWEDTGLVEHQLRKVLGR